MEFAKLNEKFKKSFELAQQGECLAFPNPLVACLIYYQEQLLCHGIHRAHRQAHAEVIAINNFKEIFQESYKDKFNCLEDFAKECELILNLEPCSHYGNTPPCTKLIIETGFKKIAFASYDTNPKVFKKSLEIFADKSFVLKNPDNIQDSAIKEEAKYLNRVFFALQKKEQEQKLPIWLTIKIAAYADGNMLTKKDDEFISSAQSRQDVHRLRATQQIIITSSSTIKSDNPQYTVRHSSQELGLLDSKNPDICVLYHKNKIELNDNAKNSRKVIYKNIASLEKEELTKIITELNFQGYQKIMLEAGPRLTQAFLNSGLADEVIIYENKSSRTKTKFSQDTAKSFALEKFQHEKIYEFEDDFKLVKN